MVELRDSKGHFARGNTPWNKRLDNSPSETTFAMTELVRRKVTSGGVLKVKPVPVRPMVISEGAVKLERVIATCPACGQQVEAVATDGRVKGYCTVARQSVSFLIETQPEMKAPTDSEVSSTSAEQPWQDPEFRAKMSALAKQRWQDPEYRAKISAARKKRGQDPEFRAKMSAARKKRWQDPEYRAKMSAAAKKQWQNPEYRARQSSIRKGNHPTDETRAKISASVTRWHNKKGGVGYAATRRHSKTKSSIGSRV